MAAVDSSGLTKRQAFEILGHELELERSSFIPTWRDLADYQVPRRPRFFVSDTNRGERRNHKIIDSTATYALRTLSAGMMGGVTSPARPWFRLAIADPDLNEYGPVKEWLHIVETRMSAAFLRSNLYNALPVIYTDLGAFATAALIVEEDFDEVLRATVFPIGSYMIATDARGKVNTFFREFRMTVRQLVEKFARRSPSGEIDWSNLSERVRESYRNKRFNEWVEVRHVICPNENYDPRKAHARFKRFTSAYYEKCGPGDDASDDRFLRESGYDYFPVLAPRWGVTGEDAYGTQFPGLDTLGDNKQLQQGERRIAEAIDKLIRPPMKGPAVLKNSVMDATPGGMTFVDERDGQKGFTPAFQIDPRIQEMEMKQEQVRNRIRRGYFEDLFLMLSYSDRRQITAREIEERHEEKLIALGPVLEQLNQDLLDPLIDIAFQIMMRQRMIPPPPEEIQGAPLKVEYISVMAQAQKMIGVGGMERFLGFISNAAQIDPRVVHKADFLQMADEYGQAMGVSPKVLRSDEQVAEILDAEAAARAQAEQMAAMKEMASTTKDLAAANLNDENALSAMVEAMSGGGAIEAGGAAAL